MVHGKLSIFSMLTCHKNVHVYFGLRLPCHCLDLVSMHFFFHTSAFLVRFDGDLQWKEKQTIR